MSQTYDTYDAFAAFYNRHWGGGFITRIYPVLQALVLDDLPDGAAICDLCCGPGHLAGRLTAAGFRVIGVDGSAALLAFARTNAPAATLLHADARDFIVPEPCAAVLATYDSLNHLMTLDALTAAFRRAHAALQPGGVFVFDLNTAESFTRNWRDSFSILTDDDAAIINAHFDSDTAVADMVFAVFTRQNSHWTRSDVTLTQRAYSNDEIMTALAAAGFVNTAIYGHDTYAALGEGRIVVRALRPTVP